MKTAILTFSAIAVTLFSLSARADSSHSRIACLVETKKWFYENTPYNEREALAHATDFCRSGGEIQCVIEAKDWYYKNTSDNTTQALQHAIELCSGNMCK